MSIKTILMFLLFCIGTIFLFISRKQTFKFNYFFKTIAYILFYSALFIYLMKYLSISSIENKLDMFVSISATLAGFVFTGLAIILALIEFEHIKNLFKNDFLDNLFYRGYGSVFLSVCNIILYLIINQYDLNNKYLMFVNQYLFGASLLLLVLMLFDFIFAIRQLKQNLKK